MPGSVLGARKISQTSGGFIGPLEEFDLFGNAIAALGDLDGDGVGDLAVGAYGDDGGGLDRGAVWILFLNADSTVKGQQKIGDLEGGFTGQLDDLDGFGSGLANLGDLGGDGSLELAVGACCDDDGGSGFGAVWILSLDGGGAVIGHQKISATSGGFTGQLNMFDQFGAALAAAGDIDDDSIPDLVVGARNDDSGGSNRGAVYVLFLNADGTVRQHQKISATDGGFTGPLEQDGDSFGSSVAGLGDLDGDGVEDLLVGAAGIDGGGLDKGGVFIVLLNPGGTVKLDQEISSGQGGFGGVPQDFSGFALACASLGDTDGDGVQDIAIGNVWDDDGPGSDLGAVWFMTLETSASVECWLKVSSTSGGLPPVLENMDQLGLSVVPMGDPDQDGVPEVAVGAIGDDDGGPPGTNRGAVWILSSQGGTASGSVSHNGSGTNPELFTQVTAPQLGGEWITAVDLVTPGAVASLVSIGTPAAFGIPTSFGELLCFPPYVARDVAFGTHAVSIPCDPSLLGAAFGSQGAVIRLSPFGLSFTNAIDFTIGTY